MQRPWVLSAIVNKDKGSKARAECAPQVNALTSNSVER